MTRQVTDYLAHEHQQLSLLLNELQQHLSVLHLAKDQQASAERLIALRRQISEFVESHVSKEEQILYPALEEHVQGIGFTLKRMREEHNVGDQTEKAFRQELDRLVNGAGNPQTVVQSGRNYIGWLRNHLLEENGRLFPLVERGLDSATQQDVRREMEGRAQAQAPAPTAALSGSVAAAV